MDDATLVRLSDNIIKVAEMCRTLAEGAAELLRRQKELEHVVALQYYFSLHPGTERGKIGSLLSAGRMIRLVPRGTAELVVEAQT